MRTRCFLVLLLTITSLLHAQEQYPGSTAAQETGGDGWIEVAVVVHGITPERHVPDEDKGYIRFEENLRTAFYKLGLDHQFAFPFGKDRLIFTYYGSPRAARISGDNSSNNLEYIQQIIGEYDASIWERTVDEPESMLRQTALKGTRDIMLYGISDAFYYTSPDGGSNIRAVILRQVQQEMIDRGILEADGNLPEGKKLSFTIFAHSLGAIVMFDLLNYIFGEEGQLEEATTDPEGLDILRDFNLLRKAGRVRVRTFFTMGTQLPVLYLRYPNALEQIGNGHFRNVEHIFPTGQGVEDPRWINLWDKDDVLGYPLAYLFTLRSGSNAEIVRDYAVDAGDYVPHIAYWWTEEVAVRILQYYFRLDGETLGIKQRRRP